MFVQVCAVVLLHEQELLGIAKDHRAETRVFPRSQVALGNARRTRYTFTMSTLAEIEAAVDQLPPTQQEKLFAFLAGRLGRGERMRSQARRGLKAATALALEGLPADLSVGTKDRVRAMVAKRHGANR